MLRNLAILLLFLVPSAALSSEFPGIFPPRSPAEEAFRRARLLEVEKPAEAIATYRELLESGFPAADALHWALGRLLPGPEAEEHWQAIVSTAASGPFAAEALRNLAKLYTEQERFAEAEAVLREVLRLAPNRAARARATAELLSLLGRSGNAEEAQRTAKVLWTEYAALPESREAERFLAPPEGGTRLDALTDEEALARGLALLNGGSREEAAKTLGALRTRLPPESPLLGRTSLALGKALCFLRRFGEALAPLEVARVFPEHEEEARSLRARALFGLDKGDVGARELLALAQQRPQSPGAPRYLEQAYRVLENRGLSTEALEARTLLLQKYAKSPEARQARWFLGWSAFRDGRYAEAAESFRVAAEGAERGWLRAEALYWEARSVLSADEAERGNALLGELIREYPLGYYARLARRELEGKEGALVGDARLSQVRPLPALGVEPVDVQEAEGDAGLARASAYLRLGLPEAARGALKDVPATDPRKARLAFWAEDFHAALKAARTTWLNWPDPTAGSPALLGPEGLAFPFAYPRSASEAARRARIHPHLLLAVAHTESHFDPRVYSVAEARGLMQFIPSTGTAVARAAGLADFTVDALYDPRTALVLGALHLRELLDRFSGDVVLAVAAYNAGASAVAKWKEARPKAAPEVFVESIPFAETRRYVKKVLTALDAYGRLDPPGLWVD
jgi:soluble lytic murein transglycosylase